METNLFENLVQQGKESNVRYLKNPKWGLKKELLKTFYRLKPKLFLSITVIIFLILFGVFSLLKNLLF